MCIFQHFSSLGIAIVIVFCLVFIKATLAHFILVTLFLSLILFFRILLHSRACLLVESLSKAFMVKVLVYNIMDIVKLFIQDI